MGITNLTREQAAAIFTGEVTQWSEVGGPDVEIVVFVQEPDDTMTVTFQDFLLNGVDFAESAEVLLSEFDVFPVVEGLTGAVSYASIAGVKSMEADKMMEVINPINLDGLSPEDPDYWLISQIGLAWLPDRQEFVEPFLEWVVDMMDSSIARMLMERYGVISGNPIIPDVVSPSGTG